MPLRHPFLIGAAVVAAAVAVVIALHATAAAPPAATLTWGPAPLPSGAPVGSGSGAAAATGIPIPQAPPHPPAASSPLGGLQLPLSALFQQLNGETRNTAVGQLSILGEIGDAIRDRITQFLNWVTGAR